MLVETTLIVLFLGLIADAAFGFPDFLYRRIGHPVTWIAKLIGVLDAAINRSTFSAATRRLAGLATLAITIAVPVVLAAVLQWSLAGSAAGMVVLAVVASVMFASRSLHTHVRDVAAALESGGVESGRTAVARIVGRDPQMLDDAGVARAAIESLAENASDGVVAPVFWFAVLGLPGLVAYKAINTADSMIGHRTLRHEDFGWAAARLDDIVNLPASRLTGALFAVAAALLPGASARNACAAMWRDASKHRSPNAGWPESAMAGALGLKLNGPRQYAGVAVDDAYMGDGRREATAADVRRSLMLAGIAWAVMLAAIGCAWLIAPA